MPGVKLRKFVLNKMRSDQHTVASGVIVSHHFECLMVRLLWQFVLSIRRQPIPVLLQGSFVPVP